jgi:hypothetical protein
MLFRLASPTIFRTAESRTFTVEGVAFGIIWRSVSEIFGVVTDLLYDLRQTGT